MNSMRALCLWALALVMPGAPHGAAAQPAAAKAPEGTRVTLPSFVVLPSLNNFAEGEIREFGTYEAILDLPLAYPVAAHLEATADIMVHGLHFRIRPDIQLVKVAAAAGGDLASLPGAALIACWGDNMWEDLRRDNPALTAVQLAQKVYSNPKPCLIDSDNDGRFDRAFFSEQKIPAERTSVPITPASYRLAEKEPAREWRLSLRILPEFLVESLQFYLLQQGTWEALGAIQFPDNAVPAAIKSDPVAKKAWKRAHIEFFPGSVLFNSKYFPSPLEFGNGKLTLLKYDRAAKRMTLRLDQMPQGFQVRPSADGGPMESYLATRTRTID